jgi:hypothetical protein
LSIFHISIFPAAKYLGESGRKMFNTIGTGGGGRWLWIFLCRTSYDDGI